MRIGAFEIEEPLPELKDTQAIAILRPWIDAGNVGSLLLSWLERQTDARGLAALARPGRFFDFTRYRPMLYGSGGRRRLVVPNAYVTCGRQAEGRDFVFLHLLEPHALSEIFTDSIMELLERLHVTRYSLVGSMYDFVPHTRPLLVTGGAEGEAAAAELEKLGVAASDYEGPTTICYVISQQASAQGIASATLIVHLPQYTQLEEDYMGVLRLKEVVAPFYGFQIDAESLDRARRQREQITASASTDPQIREIIEKLEESFDAGLREKKSRDETLSPEVEDFLREMEKRFRREQGRG
jgi:predicted ATP-grasp superfamily ATP-dependent carboligase